MLNFKDITLSDRDEIEFYLKQEDSPLLNYTFQIQFLYQPIYNYQYAVSDNLLFLKTSFNEHQMLFFPVGKGDKKQGILKMLKNMSNTPYTIHCYQVTPERKTLMEQMFPDKFEFTPLRDRFEYVYLRERLATLIGRALQQKRNNINHLSKHHEWQYEAINDDNIADCMQLEQTWNEEHGMLPGSILDLENRTTKRCFEYYKTLNIDGGLIRLDGKVSSFSFGCQLNSNTYLILFEKAHPNIRGLYSVMNQQFILHNAMSYTYINREEDCGDSGLRTAKMQYHPYILQEVYCAHEKDYKQK
jgi:hypothetical protein